MSVYASIKDRIHNLKKKYDSLKPGKDALLQVIDEAELPENVFNSNAIENSTLSLKETERILMELEVSRKVTVREVFEAKNLSRLIEYKKNKAQDQEINIELILLLHKMLLSGINDEIAGRFRKENEYVRIGTFIACPPEFIKSRLDELVAEYTSDFSTYFLEKIAKFHLDFEVIHPFNDGNGRLGRVLINYHLLRLGFPRVIIRQKDKVIYNKAFTKYINDKKTKPMEQILELAVTESLNKRIAYLEGKTIINLSAYVSKNRLKAPAVFNSAKRQTLNAFREKGVWKIGI